MNKHSCHPPNVKKQIPPKIEQMITRNCSSEEEFNKVKDEYQTSLIKSGYSYELKYNAIKTKKKRSRKRTVTYFNPPWSDDCKTNIAARFLKLVDGTRLKFKETP